MNQQKLTFRFHNPNAVDDTATYILKLLLDANRGKMEQEIQVTESEQPDLSDNDREG